MSEFIERLLILIGRQLRLCCNREVGNIPPAMLGHEIRAGRLR